MVSIKIIKRNRSNKDGKYPLQLRITKNRKTIRIGINQVIESLHWDSVKNKVKSTHPNYKELKTYILDKLSHANRQALLLEVEDPDYSLSTLKNRILGQSIKETFFSVADSYFERLVLAGNIERVRIDKPCIKRLSEFVGKSDLEFKDISVELLKKYQAYLVGKYKVKPRTISNYMISIRTIFNIGIKEGYAKKENYPFGKGKIQIKKIESTKIGLEAHEVQQIEELDLPKGSFLNHARLVWLFSFYFAGMRVSDLLMLKWSDFVSGRLYYTMGKNNKPGSVKIPDKAKDILQLYSDQKDKTGLVFPDMKNVPNLTDKSVYKPYIRERNKKLNKHLKQIAELINLEKPLTMHIARHTFGNIAGDKIPLTQLQQLYRHSSIETTINYQKAFMNKGTDDALDAVVNFKSDHNVSEPIAIYHQGYSAISI